MCPAPFYNLKSKHMLKKYEAKSQVNMSVRLKSGANVHVSFSPKTGGGSVYYTRDEAIQYGLEHHGRFGRLFRLAGIVDETPAPVPVVNEETEPEKKKVIFRSNDDAKDYLADKFGISRSKLRSRAAIEECAAKNDIEIEWK